jgi:hypothetical protein
MCRRLYRIAQEVAMRAGFRVAACVLAAALALLIAPAAAQTTFATITGVVTDPAGAAVSR